MSRRMLVNALTPEELRVAILNGNELENFQIEVTERGLTRGNIYRGIVTNVQPSLNAAFIDYGVDKHGFLPFHDIVSQQFHRDRDNPRRIEHAIEKGRPITVQVVRDAEGQKGAALTTNISLAGRYLVFSPWDDTRGVSRKVEDEDARKKLKAQLADLKIPDGAGLIARTNAVGQTKVDLKRDLTAILRTWKKIEQDGQRGNGAQLLHRDQNIVLRVMRDYVDASLDEIIIDDQAAWEAAKNYAETFMPRSNIRIQLWEERTPLFSRYDIETKIEQIHARTVPLPTGGSIVIDHTEALVAIDVNSGRNTRGSSQEETAISTNVEAARAIAKQLRLRDIGGLIVVDFIDMRGRKGRTDVVKTLREEMKSDKARSSISGISENGLVEINRQRIQQALHLRTRRPCPTCDGSGRIASPEMIGLNLLRKIEGRAVTGNLSGVRIALHPELADALQNGRRAQLAALETEFGIHIEIIASSRLHRPDQEVEWFERPRDTSAAAGEAPARATSPQSEATSTEGGGRKKKRRRRKKNGHPHEETSHDLQLATTDHHDVDHDDEHEDDHDEDQLPLEASAATAAASGDGEGRKKRRRRRRKHGREHDEAVATQQLPLDQPGSRTDDDHEEEHDEVLSPETSPAAAGDGEGRKKRRRRRRKGGAAQAASPAAIAQGAGETADVETGSDADAGAAPEEGGEPVPAQAGSEGRKKRRRRRKRRGGQGQEALPAGTEDLLESDDEEHEPLPSAWIWDEPSAEEAPAAEAAPVDEEADEETEVAAEPVREPEPPAPKKRSRRRRTRSEGAKDEEAQAAPAETEEAETLSEPEEAAPPPAPGRAARKRPARRKSAEPAVEQPEEPEQEPAAEEKPKAAPKRRAAQSRRKKETPAVDPEPAAEDEPSAAPKRRRATRRKPSKSAANSQKTEE